MSYLARRQLGCQWSVGSSVSDRNMSKPHAGLACWSIDCFYWQRSRRKGSLAGVAAAVRAETAVIYANMFSWQAGFLHCQDGAAAVPAAEL